MCYMIFLKLTLLHPYVVPFVLLKSAQSKNENMTKKDLRSGLMAI